MKFYGISNPCLGTIGFKAIQDIHDSVIVSIKAKKHLRNKMFH